MSSGSFSSPTTPLPSHPARAAASAKAESDRAAMRAIVTCLVSMEASMMIIRSSGLAVETALVSGIEYLFVDRRRRIHVGAIRADGTEWICTLGKHGLLGPPVLPDQTTHVGVAAPSQEQPVRALLEQQVYACRRSGGVRQWPQTGDRRAYAGEEHRAAARSPGSIDTSGIGRVRCCRERAGRPKLVQDLEPRRTS